MKNIIKKLVGDPWWKLIIGLLCIFAFFGITSDTLIALFTNNSWIVNAIAFSLLWGAFVFSIHAYYLAKNSNKTTVKIITIFTAKLDDHIKKTASQFAAVAEALEAHQQCISHAMDSIGKTQDDFDKRFERLYKQITDDKDPT